MRYSISLFILLILLLRSQAVPDDCSVHPYTAHAYTTVEQQNTQAATDDELFRVAIRNDAQKVKQLLAGGANANAKDREGHRLLTAAAEAGYINVVKVLIAAGANLNAEDEWECTALKQAVEFMHLDVVEALLAAGADVNAKDSFGKTPLFIADCNCL